MKPTRLWLAGKLPRHFDAKSIGQQLSAEQSRKDGQRFGIRSTMPPTL
jgi:hypothetical protein